MVCPLTPFSEIRQGQPLPRRHRKGQVFLQKNSQRTLGYGKDFLLFHTPLAEPIPEVSRIVFRKFFSRQLGMDCPLWNAPP
jgi:hypothetical protein